MIQIKDLVFSYDGQKNVLNNISLNIKKGERIALLGVNGSGKTTLAKNINRLLVPSGGYVMIDGENTKNHSIAEISRLVGYVFQNPNDQIFKATVWLEIAYALERQGLPRVEIDLHVSEAMKMSGLTGLEDVNPYDLPLSKRRFVTIASILAINPKVYIFDEPTAGQDIEEWKILLNILDILYKKGKTTITITHDMDFAAQFFQRLILMKDGEIIKTGSPKEIFCDESLLEAAGIKAPFVTRLLNKIAPEAEEYTIEGAAEFLRNHMRRKLHEKNYIC